MKFEPESEAVFKLKMQIGAGLMKNGPAFFNSKEFKEIQQMLKEVRQSERLAQE